MQMASKLGDRDHPNIGKEVALPPDHKQGPAVVSNNSSLTSFMIHSIRTTRSTHNFWTKGTLTRIFLILLINDFIERERKGKRQRARERERHH